jgi:hypothetical protein
MASRCQWCGQESDKYIGTAVLPIPLAFMVAQKARHDGVPAYVTQESSIVLGPVCFGCSQKEKAALVTYFQKEVAWLSAHGIYVGRDVESLEDVEPSPSPHEDGAKTTAKP